MKLGAGTAAVIGVLALVACTAPAVTTPPAGGESSLNTGGPTRTGTKASPAASSDPGPPIPTLTPGGAGPPIPAASASAGGSPSPTPSGTAPSASPTASPAAGIAATPTPATVGLEVTAKEAADRPAALVNYDNGEIIWVPGEPVLKWAVKARTAVTVAKVELRLGAEASAAYRLTQADPTATPSATPSPAPTLDTSFVPTPEPSPTATPTPAVGGKPSLTQVHELPLAAIGVPAELGAGATADLVLRPNAQVIQAYLRQVRPLNLVYVSVALIGPQGQPIKDGETPVVLTGQFLVK